MNPQFLFNFALAFLTIGLILIFKGLFVIGFGSLILAVGAAIVWLMSGFFDKFEYSSPEESLEDDKDEEGKGVLKPF